MQRNIVGSDVFLMLFHICKEKMLNARMLSTSKKFLYLVCLEEQAGDLSSGRFIS